MEVKYEKDLGWRGPIPYGPIWFAVLILIEVFLWHLGCFTPECNTRPMTWIQLTFLVLFCVGFIYSYAYLHRNIRHNSLYWRSAGNGVWTGDIKQPDKAGLVIEIPWTGWFNHLQITYAGWQYDSECAVFRNGHESLNQQKFLAFLEALSGLALPADSIFALLMLRPTQYRRIRVINRGPVVEVKTRNRGVYRFDDPEQLVHFLLHGAAEFSDLQNRWWNLRQDVILLAGRIKEWFPSADFTRGTTVAKIAALLEDLHAMSKELARGSGVDLKANPAQTLFALLDQVRDSAAWVSENAPDLKDKSVLHVLTTLDQHRSNAVQDCERLCEGLLKLHAHILAKDRRGANGATAKYMLAMIVYLVSRHLPEDHPLRSRYGITAEAVTEAARVMSD